MGVAYMKTNNNGRQRKVPYFTMVKNYADNKVLTFHCPGHQQGKGIHRIFKDFLGENVFSADITQIYGMDDIHQPKSIVKEAQRLAAEAYSADNTYFLINGSSSGNQAMLLSVCNPQDEIILPRNAHKSITSALILSGAVPVYIQPEYDEEIHVDHTVTLEKVKSALKAHPKAKAVLILSPTYYGACADLKNIVKLIHDYGKIAMVDEAWGPHLGFNRRLPSSAMQSGADISVNSTHKLISGFSQGSMLHVKGKRIDKGKLQAVLRIFLSTSPNSLIVSSLDVARMQMATSGKKLLDRAIDLADMARKKINRIKGMKVFGPEITGRPGVNSFDPTRLVFTAARLGFTGYSIEKILRLKYNIQIELSDIFNIIALITIGHSKDDLDRLIEALEDISRNSSKDNLTSSDLFHKYMKKPIILPDFPPFKMSPREAFFSSYKTINFSNAKGFISAEVVTPYPPGIPILCPGEEITQEIIDYIKLEIKAGMHIQGPVDSDMKTIRVVKNN